MADKVRFGIIGAGMISHFHAKAIADAAGAELVSVTDPVKARLDDFVAQHKVRGYENLADFLADPELDAITVATPSGFHLDPVVAAAKAGKHVLCEKPLEITPERAQTIIDACRDNKVVLAPVFQYRFSPAAKLMKKAVAEGRFGKLLLASAKIKWYRTQEYYDSGAWRGTWNVDGGGCLMNQSIHAIDLFLFLAGRPTEVYGRWATVGHERIEVEDNAAAVLAFENGAFGTIEASTCCQPGWPLEVELSGTRGTAAIRAQSIVKWEFADSDPLDAEAEELMKTPAANSGASDPSTIDTRGHQLVIEDMVKTILTGENRVIPGWEAKLPLQVICGVYEAQKTGMPAKIS